MHELKLAIFIANTTMYQYWEIWEKREEFQSLYGVQFTTWIGPGGFSSPGSYTGVCSCHT